MDPCKNKYIYIDNCTKLFKFIYDGGMYSIYYYMKIYGSYIPKSNSKALIRIINEYELDNTISYIKLNKLLPPL
jgi:hypothetical protein